MNTVRIMFGWKEECSRIEVVLGERVQFNIVGGNISPGYADKRQEEAD